MCSQRDASRATTGREAVRTVLQAYRTLPGAAGWQRQLRSPISTWCGTAWLVAALLACSRAAPEETPSVETLFLSANDAQARGDRVGAERSLRRALARATDARATEADRRLEVSVRATLAALLVQSQRETEAREVARPACGRGAHGESAPQLVVLGLCAR